MHTAPTENDVLSAPRLRKSFLRKGLRFALLGGVVVAVIMQIVALSPSSVDDSQESSAPIDPSVLIPHEKSTLAKGIPSGRVPEYSVDQFNYISTHESVKEWNLIASRADMYNAEKIVHARVVKAYLFDTLGQATVVTGQEAKYVMPPVTPTGEESRSSTGKPGTRDLEIYGDVKTVFPDGFEIDSDYMRYQPDLRMIEIPSTYEATGKGSNPSGQLMTFVSRGLTYSMGRSEILLHRDVRVTIESPPDPSQEGGPDKTLIRSDHCDIDRTRQIAHFTMDPERPLAERFVTVIQPTLFSRGRRGDLNYGDIHASGPSDDSPKAKLSKSKRPARPSITPDGSRIVNHIVLYDDVFLKEKEKGAALEYATSGRADFDGAKNLVVLTVFPQIYQGGDTATGDRIVLHRDTGIVEVEHSNSFSRGDDASN